jgi:hypothetical protein
VTLAQNAWPGFPQAAPSGGRIYLSGGGQD